MKRVLLVDDEALLRRMLRVMLEKMGHSVVEAGDGREALQRMAEQPFDVLLTDLIMPDREGIEVIAEVRRTHPQIGIIAMSGGGRIDARDLLKIARHLGAHRILAKPFSEEELSSALNAVPPDPGATA